MTSFYYYYPSGFCFLGQIRVYLAGITKSKYERKNEMDSNGYMHVQNISFFKVFFFDTIKQITAP